MTERDPIDQVLTALSDRIRAERKESTLYQELAERPTMTSRLRLAEHKMSMIVLALVDVLRDVDDIEIDHENYHMLKSLVALKGDLSRHYQETEGSAGCVDKAYQEIARRLRETT